jgi:hypothetical protein
LNLNTIAGGGNFLKNSDESGAAGSPVRGTAFLGKPLNNTVKIKLNMLSQGGPEAAAGGGPGDTNPQEYL